MIYTLVSINRQTVDKLCMCVCVVGAGGYLTLTQMLSSAWEDQTKRWEFMCLNTWPLFGTLFNFRGLALLAEGFQW